jgi:hypothetical protein
LEDVEEAVVPGLHEIVEQIRISVEGTPEEISHHEDFMSVRDLRDSPQEQHRYWTNPILSGSPQSSIFWMTWS